MPDEHKAREVEGLVEFYWRMAAIQHWDAAFAAIKIISELYNDAYGICTFPMDFPPRTFVAG